MTTTSAFGTAGRVGHDASGFYDRFDAVAETKVRLAELPAPLDLPDPTLVAGDARDMGFLPDGAVALVVTSPPYFAGKTYEARPGAITDGGDGSPGTWGEYLELLADSFAECRRVLEPGGRIAVNVANLGRKPYRSLSGEVGRLLEATGFWLRGEHVWVKSDAASGSCAFGSWRSPSNPSMRDLSERIVVASKGSFARVGKASERRKASRPHEATISAADFMAWTYDVWRIRPESARRVGHPAPFPVELPRRLIELHTWAGEWVLDPFCGSGSAGVAAAAGRRFVGVDLDPAYVELAANRLAAPAPPT